MSLSHLTLDELRNEIRARNMGADQPLNLSGTYQQLINRIVQYDDIPNPLGLPEGYRYLNRYYLDLDFDCDELILHEGDHMNTIYHYDDYYIKVYDVRNDSEYLAKEINIGLYLYKRYPKNVYQILGLIPFRCDSNNRDTVGPDDPTGHRDYVGVVSRAIEGQLYAKWFKTASYPQVHQLLSRLYFLLLELNENDGYINPDLGRNNLFIGLDTNGYYPILLDFELAKLGPQYRCRDTGYCETWFLNMLESSRRKDSSEDSLKINEWISQMLRIFTSDHRCQVNIKSTLEHLLVDGSKNILH